MKKHQWNWSTRRSKKRIVHENLHPITPLYLRTLLGFSQKVSVSSLQQSPSQIASDMAYCTVWWEASMRTFLRNWWVSTRFSEQGGRNNMIYVDQWERRILIRSSKSNSSLKNEWMKDQFWLWFVYSCKFHTHHLINSFWREKVRRHVVMALSMSKIPKDL